MKRFKYLAILSGLTMLAGGPWQFVSAQSPEDKAGFNELKHTKLDRSSHFEDLLPPENIETISKTQVPLQKPAKLEQRKAITRNITVKPRPATTTPVVAKTTKKPVTTVAKTTVKPHPGVTAVAKQPAPTPSTQVLEREPSEGTHVVPVAQTTHAAPTGTVITAWLNKQGPTPKYKVGDKMVLNVAATVDCNVLVFDYDSTGSLTQLFPNEFQSNGFVKAGESVQIGGPDTKFDLEINGNGGMERIFVYAYPTTSEAPFTVAMNPIPHTPFRSTEMSLDKYRELVNQSKVFFSRGVAVVPKQHAPQAQAKLVSTSSPAQGSKAEADNSQSNKIELSFQVIP